MIASEQNKNDRSIKSRTRKLKHSNIRISAANARPVCSAARVNRATKNRCSVPLAVGIISLDLSGAVVGPVRVLIADNS